MKAKIDLRVEILEGEDEGYILEETNRIVDLENSLQSVFPEKITPYRITVEFVTPDLLRRKNRRGEE